MPLTGKKAGLTTLGTAMVALVIAVLMTAAAFLAVGRSHAVEEVGPVELAHLTVWYLGTCYALGGALWAAPRDRGTLLMLALLGAAAAMRETDLHRMLNPETMGYWGVHYRLRWWMSTREPILPRLFWAGIGAVGIAYGIHIVRRVLPALGRGQRWIGGWILTVAVFAGIGAACDDLLRHRVPHLPAQIVEETSESAAAIAYVLMLLRYRRLYDPAAGEGPDLPAAQEKPVGAKAGG
jgi:hypothetical protein